MRASPATVALIALAGCAAAHDAEPEGPALYLTLPSLDGGSIDVTEFRGAPLVVHVFTTWAMPVTADVERLRTLKEVKVIGVALDTGRANVVRAWRRAMDVAYPIALADDAVRTGRSMLGSTRQIPVTLMYDSRGRLIRRWDGALGDSGIAEIRDLADTSR